MPVVGWVHCNHYFVRHHFKITKNLKNLGIWRPPYPHLGVGLNSFCVLLLSFFSCLHAFPMKKIPVFCGKWKPNLLTVLRRLFKFCTRKLFFWIDMSTFYWVVRWLACFLSAILLSKNPILYHFCVWNSCRIWEKNFITNCRAISQAHWIARPSSGD